MAAVPRLTYTPPADLYHSALSPPEIYDSVQTNASIQVYHFRQAPPGVLDLFQAHLLRDWVAPDYQEQQLAAPPKFGPWQVPGADVTQFAQFTDVNFGGMLRPRMRMLVLSGGFAAVLDAQAHTPQAWAIAQPSFQMFMASLRVERDAGRSHRAIATVASRKLAGLYVGVKPKFVSAIGPGIGAGSGGFVWARHIYLFSDNDRVYRAYDEIPDGSDFDFDGAAVSNPVNSGRYAIEGKQLILQMGERLDEEIVVALPNRGRLIIEGVDYTRQ